MIKSNSGSASPKLLFSSPRATIDLTITSSKKLPSIRDRATPNVGKRFFSSGLNGSATENTERFQIKNINFFEVKSPVDDRKLALVKNTLGKKKDFPRPDIQLKRKCYDKSRRS